MNIKINDNKINRVDFVKSLGLHIDEHLSVHIFKLCKNIASAIDAILVPRAFLTRGQPSATRGSGQIQTGYHKNMVCG
jgi:hypothetical protein